MKRKKKIKKPRGSLIPPNKTFPDLKKEEDKTKARKKPEVGDEIG